VIFNKADHNPNPNISQRQAKNGSKRGVAKITSDNWGLFTSFSRGEEVCQMSSDWLQGQKNGRAITSQALRW